MKPTQFSKVMKSAVKDISDPRQLMTDIGLIAVGGAMRVTPVATGTLRRSITHRVEGRAVYIGTSVEYAQFVHDGTRYMAPRPFLQEGINNSVGEIQRKAAEYAGKLFDRVGRG